MADFTGKKVGVGGFHLQKEQHPINLPEFTTLEPGQNMSSTLDVASIFAIPGSGSASCMVSAEGSILALPPDIPADRIKRYELERMPYETSPIRFRTVVSVNSELRVRDSLGAPLNKRIVLKDAAACTDSQIASMEAAFLRAGKLAAYARDQLSGNKNPQRLVCMRELK